MSSLCLEFVKGAEIEFASFISEISDKVDNSEMRDFTPYPILSIMGNYVPSPIFQGLLSHLKYLFKYDFMQANQPHLHISFPILTTANTRYSFSMFGNSANDATFQLVIENDITSVKRDATIVLNFNMWNNEWLCNKAEVHLIHKPKEGLLAKLGLDKY